MKDALQDNMMITFPIKINYKVLEAFLQEELIGEEIKKEKENGEDSVYAEILGVALEKSLEEGFDLAIRLRFKTLTSLFKNKEGDMLLNVSINFDENEQELTVKDYKLRVNSNSWLMNKTIQTFANSFVYDKLKNKMKFDFRPHIEKQLISMNKKLENSLEAVEGIFFSGALVDVKVRKIIPGDNLFLAFVEIEGRALVDIKKINF